MRYSDDHKAATRQRVLREAAREIRAKGPDNIAVAGVMARAGLTHGGFYAHFESKDALVIEAIETMFLDAHARFGAFDGADDPRAALLDYIDFYLSHAHRDARERGCPLPALSVDLARSTSASRARFAAGVSRLTDRLGAALHSMDVADPASEASVMLTQMVGAVVLARAVDGAASDAILASARAALVGRYGLEPAR